MRKCLRSKLRWFLPTNSRWQTLQIRPLSPVSEYDDNVSSRTCKQQRYNWEDLNPLPSFKYYAKYLLSYHIECMHCMCIFKLFLRFDRWLQIGHLNGFSPLCILICCFKLLLLDSPRKTFPHILQRRCCCCCCSSWTVV